MRKSTWRFTKIACAIGVALVIGVCQLARAGWSVNVGFTTGQGTVTVKVTSASGAISTTNVAFKANPSAAINQKSTFVYDRTNALPAGANLGTYVQVRAGAYGATSIQSTNVAGDLGDSDDLIGLIIPSSACASASVEIQPGVQTTPNSITFQYRAKLSDEGSAVLLEVKDRVTGQTKYVVLLVGPYDNTDPDSCEGTVTVTGNIENLDLVMNGHTSTLPFSIACPSDQVLACGAAPPAIYDPAPVVTSSLPYTLTYDKLPNQLVLGVTNTVTATATDINGCSVSCQFKVYRGAIDFIGFDAPINPDPILGNGTCTSPLRSFRLGNVVPVKFAMLCNGVPIVSGTPPRIKIQNCNGSDPTWGLFEVFNNEWHFNIDSTVIRNPGIYTITAILPDGSEHSVVIQYTRK